MHVRECMSWLFSVLYMCVCMCVYMHVYVCGVLGGRCVCVCACGVCAGIWCIVDALAHICICMYVKQ